VILLRTDASYQHREGYKIVIEPMPSRYANAQNLPHVARGARDTSNSSRKGSEGANYAGSTVMSASANRLSSRR
jgi:hypothetical protein